VSEQLQHQPTEENAMTAHEAVARYYEAWQTKQGDLADVPLADDFEFTGPVASFDSAEGYRAMAREAGQAVTSFEVRRQFVDGDTVCSIIDWEMAIPGVGRMTSAELLEVKDGQIVRGELIYDAEELRRAMAAANSGTRTE
jgi:ketosteroid isomerase-like protein